MLTFFQPAPRRAPCLTTADKAAQSPSWHPRSCPNVWFSWVSRDIPNFLGPPPLTWKTPTHRKISGPISLGLCSFFLPDFRLFFLRPEKHDKNLALKQIKILARPISTLTIWWTRSGSKSAQRGPCGGMGRLPSYGGKKLNTPNFLNFPMNVLSLSLWLGALLCHSRVLLSISVSAFEGIQPVLVAMAMPWLYNLFGKQVLINWWIAIAESMSCSHGRVHTHARNATPWRAHTHTQCSAKSRMHSYPYVLQAHVRCHFHGALSYCERK